MNNFQCTNCKSTKLFISKSSNNTGLYCADCGSWIKWLNKNELRAFEYHQNQQKKDIIECDIPLGSLCCFRPLRSNEIYFGHMAGKVVADFENMTFIYVIVIDNRYVFSKEVIIKPDDVHTAKDAQKYFMCNEN